MPVCVCVCTRVRIHDMIVLWRMRKKKSETCKFIYIYYIYIHCGAKLSLNNVIVYIIRVFFRFQSSIRQSSHRPNSNNNNNNTFLQDRARSASVYTSIRRVYIKIYKSLFTAECKSVAEYVTGNRDKGCACDVYFTYIRGIYRIFPKEPPPSIQSTPLKSSTARST